MKNVIISLDVPEDVLLALNETKDEAKRHFQISLAAMLFQEGNFTLGKAIQMAGVSRRDFEKILEKNGIVIFDTNIDQVRLDVAKLGDI